MANERRARYFDETFFPLHREEIFPDNEPISFKAEEKRVKLLELIRADVTVGNWLDQSTRDCTSKILGSNRDDFSGVFFWIMCQMAVYRLGKGHGTPIKLIESKRERLEDGNEAQVAKRVKANSESEARTHVRPKQKQAAFSSTTQGQSKRHLLHAVADRRPPGNETNQSTPADTFAPSRPAVRRQQSPGTAQYQSLPNMPPEPLVRATERPQASGRPMTQSAPGYHTNNDQKLILAGTDWRWKIILVHFTHNRTYPFLVHAQPSLSTKDPILAADITHERFIGRIRKYGGVANDDQSLFQVQYTDKIFGNQYNLADQSQFLEALTMHEYEPEFSTSRMKVCVKKK